MRDAARAAARIPGWRVVGSLLRKTIDDFLDSRGDPLERAIRLMGSAEAEGPPGHWFHDLRVRVSKALGVAPVSESGLQGWLAQAVG